MSLINLKLFANMATNMLKQIQHKQDIQFKNVCG